MVPQSAAAMLPKDKTFCSRTLKALLDSKCAAPFKEPVDPLFYGIHDYFDIVKNPMDLGTVKKKLDNDQYDSIAGFIDDLNLMFYNCYLYNNETDPVCCDAKVLEGIFQKFLQRAKDSSNSTQPKPKKAPVKTTHRPVTPISDDSFNDNESRSGALSESDDRFDDLFGEEELSEEEEEDVVGEEKRGEKRAAADDEQEMPEEQKKRCLAMVNELKKRKYDDLTWAFKKPVDPHVWGCSDYYDIVKHPMDMSTYEQKLITNQYQHEDELAADIRLMLNNCFLYNPPDNPVHQSAKKLQHIFEKYWSKLHTTTTDTNQERPKKKLKIKTILDPKKDGGNHVASTAGTTTLRIKLRHEPKAQDEKKVDTKESSTSKIEKSHDNTQSTMDEYPSHHRRASTSSMSSTSSTRPRLAIDRDPPPATSNYRRTSTSSFSSTSSGHGYKVGDIYPEASSSKAPSRKGSFYDGFPSTRTGNAYKLGDASKASFDDRRVPASSSSSPTSDYHKLTLDRRSSSSSVNSAIDYKRPSQRDGSVHTTNNKHRGVTLRLGSSSMHTTSDTKKQGAPSNKMLAKPQRPPPQKRAPAMVSVFDIVDRMENEKKVRVEMAERERQEYVKRVTAEAERERLYREKKDELKKADREKRMAELNAGTIDISRQKMFMNQFERDVLSHDKDFRDMRYYYTKTTDFRTTVPPPFLHRLGIDLRDIGKNLLSAAGKYMNDDEDDESDMDVGDETGMEELD